MANTYKNTNAKLRQHTKNVKAPIIAHSQIHAGGTLEGVCTAKVAEAEVMVEGGLNDILITNQIVTNDKIARLCSLAKRSNIKICIDNAENLRDISQIAHSQKVLIGVLIEVQTNILRAGIRKAEEGVKLAKLAQTLPGIKFKGVMSHQHVENDKGRKHRILESRKCIQMCLDVKTAIESAGIPVEIVSSGETSTYDAVPDLSEVTEVEGGSYAMMSTGFSYLKEFEFAGKVLGTIISTPLPGIAIGDVGLLAMSGNILPSVGDKDRVKVVSMQNDHLLLQDEGCPRLTIGEKFLLIPGHQDTMVNRWDQYVAIRNNIVEAVWDIPGRGCHN